MLENSKWAPGGANYEAEADAPAPPANAPVGPRNPQSQGRRKPGAWQAGDERRNHSAEGQADHKDNETENSKLDKDLSSAQDDTQLAYRDKITRPSQEKIAWTASRTAEEKASATSLPVHSSAPLPSMKDMLPHAIQPQSDQSKRPTAATQPSARCSSAVPTKSLDGSTVSFPPKVSAEKREEQKPSDKERPVTAITEDVSSIFSTSTNDVPNEKQNVNSAAISQHETIQPLVTESTTNPDTEARIKALEDEQTNTRRNIDVLEHLYDQLSNSIKHLKTQQQGRPQTPHSSSPAWQTPSNDQCYYIPKQGNLSNDTFLFAIKLLVGRKLSASHWDRTRLQVQGGVIGRWGIASQALSTAYGDVAKSEDGDENEDGGESTGEDESEIVPQDEEEIEDGGVTVREDAQGSLGFSLAELKSSMKRRARNSDSAFYHGY